MRQLRRSGWSQARPQNFKHTGYGTGAARLHALSSTGHRPALRNRRRRGGFSILEMMSALAMLVIGAVSLFALLTTGVQQDAEASHFAIARTIAQQQMEMVRQSASLPNVPAWVNGTAPTTSTALSVTNLPGAVLNTTIYYVDPTGLAATPPVIQATQTITGLVDVIYKITWPEPGRGTSFVTLETLVCAGGINAAQ